MKVEYLIKTIGMKKVLASLIASVVGAYHDELEDHPERDSSYLLQLEHDLMIAFNNYEARYPTPIEPRPTQPASGTAPERPGS